MIYKLHDFEKAGMGDTVNNWTTHLKSPTRAVVKVFCGWACYDVHERSRQGSIAELRGVHVGVVATDAAALEFLEGTLPRQMIAPVYILPFGEARAETHN